jgi:hypothetical protein
MNNKNGIASTQSEIVSVLNKKAYKVGLGRKIIKHHKHA